MHNVIIYIPNNNNLLVKYNFILNIFLYIPYKMQFLYIYIYIYIYYIYIILKIVVYKQFINSFLINVFNTIKKELINCL